MKAQNILKKAKFVHDANGDPVEVIIPFSAYEDLLRLKISHEIYNQPETQAAVRQAREDL